MYSLSYAILVKGHLTRKLNWFRPHEVIVIQLLVIFLFIFAKCCIIGNISREIFTI